jgi:hypothetical protein
MVIADRLGAIVDCGGGENAIVEVPGQRRVAGMKAAEFVDIFFIKFRRIVCERACNAGA